MEQLPPQLSMQVSCDRTYLLFFAASAIVCRPETDRLHAVCATLSP